MSAEDDVRAFDEQGFLGGIARVTPGEKSELVVWIRNPKTELSFLKTAADWHATAMNHEKLIDEIRDLERVANSREPHRFIPSVLEMLNKAVGDHAGQGIVSESVRLGLLSAIDIIKRNLPPEK